MTAVLFSKLVSDWFAYMWLSKAQSRGWLGDTNSQCFDNYSRIDLEILGKGGLQNICKVSAHNFCCPDTQLPHMMASSKGSWHRMLSPGLSMAEWMGVYSCHRASSPISNHKFATVVDNRMWLVLLIFTFSISTFSISGCTMYISVWWWTTT